MKQEEKTKVINTRAWQEQRDSTQTDIWVMEDRL